jgi:toxic protein SymE
MQTNKHVKKSGVHRPAVRSLKIQPKYRVDRWRDTSVAPEIKLCGAWLEQLGFQCGKRVIVTTMKELLIITLQSEEASGR